MAVEKLIVDHIDTWTTALQTRSTAGRGSSGKIDLYGIKKLRELILELAVRGKLVPQDPNDEPASELLKRIAAEKAELVKQGKIKKPKPLPEISEEEKPFELPEGWEWVRFGSIYEMEYGNNLPQEKRSNSGEYDVYGSNGIVGTHNEACIKSPCIVIGRKGSAGALNLSDQAACWVTDVAYSTIPPSAMNLEFVFIQFHTLGLDTLGKGIKPGLNRNDAYNLTIAIPPQSEQKAIVSKVNEMMTLCDQLEQHSLTSLDAHQQLVETLLTTLTDSQNAEELAENWARISKHFDTLFTTEASIDALKQAILQLAVMGKLVPQDPNEEPASELLKRIAQEKAQLVKDEKMKKQKPLQPISCDNIPFNLPENWVWCRFGNIVKNLSNGLYKPESHYSNDGIISLRMYNIQNGIIDFTDVRRVKVTELERYKYILEEGDLLINRVNSKELVGKTAIIPKTKEPLLFESMNMRACLFKEIINSHYINTLFQSEFIKKELSLYAKEAISQASINQQQITELLIPLPPSIEQKNIVDKVNLLLSLLEQVKYCMGKIKNTQVHLADALTDAAIN
ncbi:restriction endonuclease subunit S [Klebsiella oxytoca]|uniref:restriction endonuclease subunit S n=1 Tax=Klebsiella oxytoca TaxID=571 RepID=UPI001CCC0BBF|nr:restriction endonuclease subunit S [Klebsiella oxytoca]EKH6436280.1 restriction endonuclease subunit S [Klebsiella oxytoca]EKJ7588871.1 restriction endonuclease subunit S [Klebsiella oxytoca]MBZ7635353.1 restriction endonuclease subunit S [Klebsiella oxytoca]MCW9506306.1 restriction endonuclease subunit S [Klebsiella oxytoca]MDM4534174.1 restriction endonuclease subunit S [Klebsiella oxytoca]